MRPIVCMVTDRRRLGARPDDELVRRASIAARAGVSLIQVRERDLGDAALAGLVRRVVEAVRGTETRVLVNDRADVALAAGAHGVHLRADSVPSGRLRRILPAGFLLGRSAHLADEVARVVRDGGLDYVIFGPIFATGSKPGVSGVGVSELARAQVMAATVPVLGIGGVTRAHARSLKGACAGFAGIGQFADGDVAQLADEVARLASAWD